MHNKSLPPNDNNCNKFSNIFQQRYVVGVAEDDDNCSAQLWNCMESAAEFAFEQANTVRVSK